VTLLCGAARSRNIASRRRTKYHPVDACIE